MESEWQSTTTGLWNAGYQTSLLSVSLPNTHQLSTKASKASTSKQKLERCHISVLYWFFRNEEVCEAASLREGSEQLWVGGANGNACGWRGCDKYLLRQTGREGREERRSAKVENFNYIWDWVIAFLILLCGRVCVPTQPLDYHCYCVAACNLLANLMVIV